MGLLKSVFFTAMMVFGCNLSRINPLKCISINNQESKIKTKIVNVNSKEPVFFPFVIKGTKFSGSCHNINGKLCVPDVAKNLNVRAFNLMSRTNETRHIEWHEMRKCKYRPGPSVCNNKKRWNKDKCRCEC